MPELRKDPFRGHWVIIAPERATRPIDHSAQQQQLDATSDTCPFCRGREVRTPAATLTIDRNGQAVAGESDWLVRVVPNFYPALCGLPADAVERSAGDVSAGDVLAGETSFVTAPGRGVHEVIIEAPDHVCSLTQLDTAQFERILLAWQTRLSQLAERSDLQHVSLFRNDGAAAGASLAHVHSQLLATPFVPPLIDTELQATVEHQRETRQLLSSRLLAEELAVGSRIVTEAAHFVVVCPFASRFPAETWVVPRRDGPDFHAIAAEERSDLAIALRDTLSRLNAGFGQPPFNLAVRTAPFRDSRRDSFCWRIEITPRLTGIAGFELSSGSWINILAPEDAARRLRDATVR